MTQRARISFWRARIARDAHGKCTPPPVVPTAALVHHDSGAPLKFQHCPPASPLALSDWQSASWLQRRIVPMYVQLVGAASLHELAHEAENAATAHLGGRSAMLSTVNVAWAQQIAAEEGQSDAVAHESDAFCGQLVAQALVCAARFAQQI